MKILGKGRVMGSLNLIKSYDFFKPEEVQERIHIIGCGSVGATIAELFVKLGLTKLSLYDFDIVESHNLTNQIYRQSHVGKEKVEALSEILFEINPNIKQTLILHREGYVSQKVTGYVILCVDSIETRYKIVSMHVDNPYIKVMFDYRTRLIDAQHYAAVWDNRGMVKNFLKSMNFNSKEAKKETPVSACNVPLSIAPTIQVISSLGVCNFINYVKNKNIKKFIQINLTNFILDSF